MLWGGAVREQVEVIHVGTKNQTQVIKIGSRPLYLLRACLGPPVLPHPTCVCVHVCVYSILNQT